MEISSLLTRSYYNFEKTYQHKVDSNRPDSFQRFEQGLEGRDEFISQDTYDHLNIVRYEMGSFAMADIADQLSEKTKDSLKTIALKDSSILEKDWDFTINENDELIILEGDDKLTSRQKSIIEKALGGQDMMASLKDFADASQVLISEERGADQHSTGLGRYDLNRSNFSEHIVIRKGLEVIEKENALDSWKTALREQLKVNGESIDIYSKRVPFRVVV